MFEARHPDFGKWIDVNQLTSVLLRSFERTKHTRVIGARILTDNENRVGFVKVFKSDSSLPNSDRFVQRRAARLVTHVRAIRKIVGAKLADKKLIKESSLVAGSARRVEDCLVWIVE